MGWYVRRSMKIAPGIRLNFSNRGMGMSVGTRGVHISTSATGRRTFSAGIPGTGIRYRETLSHKRPAQPHQPPKPPKPPAQPMPARAEVTNLPAGVKTTSVWRVLWWVLVVLFLLGGLGNTISPAPGQSWWVGPLEMAGAAYVGKWLHGTRHAHRIPREAASRP